LSHNQNASRYSAFDSSTGDRTTPAEGKPTQSYSADAHKLFSD
jgi:hypothetical protein